MKKGKKEKKKKNKQYKNDFFFFFFFFFIFYFQKFKIKILKKIIKNIHITIEIYLLKNINITKFN